MEIPAVHGVMGSEVVAGKRNDGEVVVDDSLRFITNGFDGRVYWNNITRVPRQPLPSPLNRHQGET